MSIEKREAKILVLMSTYNGEKYLEEQLNSILNQTKVKFDLLIRDDGSTDNTRKILLQYASKQPNIKLIFDDVNLGPAKSFMELVERCDDSYDYYSFSDQDDYWLPEKLYLTSQALQNDNIPEIGCCNLELVDSNLKTLKKQNKLRTTTTFLQSLNCSYCVGCTMVVNKMMMRMLKLHNPTILCMHDDWTHKLCLCLGGNVKVIDDRLLLYRQHQNNVVGGISKGIKKKFKRWGKFIFDKTRILSKQYNEMLNGYSALISDDKANEIRLLIGKKTFFTKLKIIFSKKYKTKFFKNNLRFALCILFSTY